MRKILDAQLDSHPSWTHTCKLVLLVQPSSAEGVFSMPCLRSKNLLWGTIQGRLNAWARWTVARGPYEHSGPMRWPIMP